MCAGICKGVVAARHASSKLYPREHRANVLLCARGMSRWEKKKERATNSIVAISAQEGPLGADPERIVTIQLSWQKRHCFSN